MVEIIPKKPKKMLPWQNISLYAAIAILIAVILSYAALIYFESKKLTVLEDLEGEISQFGTPEDKNLEKEVLDYQKKIEDFSVILKERHIVSAFFDKFEKLCHPKVWFSKFNLDLQKMELTLSGETSDFQIVDQQLTVFKREAMVKGLSLAELSIGKGGEVEFSLLLSFKPEIFKILTAK